MDTVYPGRSGSSWRFSNGVMVDRYLIDEYLYRWARHMLGNPTRLGYPQPIIGRMMKYGCIGPSPVNHHHEEIPNDVEMMDSALTALKVYNPEIYQSIWLFVTKPNPNYNNQDRAMRMKTTRYTYAHYLASGRAFLSGRLLSLED